MRAGCACYTTADEIERLIEGVTEIAKAIVQSPKSDVRKSRVQVCKCPASKVQRPRSASCDVQCLKSSLPRIRTFGLWTLDFGLISEPH